MTDVRDADVWFVCAKCNNSWHRVFPGEKAPYWWCQGEKVELKKGEEVEVQYLEKSKGGGNNASS